MIASTASFSAMIIAVRFLSDTIPPFEQVFLRSVVGLLITLPTVIRTFHKAAHTFRPDKIGGLYISRGLCTFTGVSAWFFAITSLPLSEAVALHFTLPIFGLLLSALILREKVTRQRWVTVASGIIGVLVILRPGIAIFDIMAFVVFLSALGYASGDICTKMLSHTQPARLIVLNLNIWLILFAAIPTVLNWHTPPLTDLPMIVFMGGTAWAAHMCLAQAMKCADASLVIPFEFIRLPITAIAAFIFFDEVPGAWALVGAAIIFFGTSQLARKEGLK